MKNKMINLKIIEKDYEELATKLLDIMNDSLNDKTHEYVTNVGVNALITLMANFVNGYTDGDSKEAADFISEFAQKIYIAFQAVNNRAKLMETAH